MAAKNKSYLNNPALQFISSALVDEANAAPETPVVEKAPVQAPQAAHARPQEAPRQEFQAAPLQNVAPAYESPIVQASQSGKFIVPMKPVFVETRSKRFNALLQPSLYDNLRKIADMNGVSVNDLMHRVLEKFVEDNMQ